MYSLYAQTGGRWPLWGCRSLLSAPKSPQPSQRINAENGGAWGEPPMAPPRRTPLPRGGYREPGSAAAGRAAAAEAVAAELFVGMLQLNRGGRSSSGRSCVVAPEKCINVGRLRMAERGLKIKRVRA